MQHVRIGMYDNYMAAVAFQPRSGGRIWEALALVVYRLDRQPIREFTTIALHELRSWPEHVGMDWAIISGVWASPTLYAGYGSIDDRPPWGLGKERDESTLFWLLGDPSIVDTGPMTGPVQECVRRISQLQDVLGRLQK